MGYNYFFPVHSTVEDFGSPPRQHSGYAFAPDSIVDRPRRTGKQERSGATLCTRIYDKNITVVLSGSHSTHRAPLTDKRHVRRSNFRTAQHVRPAIYTPRIRYIYMYTYLLSNTRILLSSSHFLPFARRPIRLASPVDRSPSLPAAKG